MDSLPVKRNLVARRRSSINSVSSEPAVPLPRKTPFTLRSQCARHGSECREGHGISLQTKTRESSKSGKKFPRKMNVEATDSVRRKLGDVFSENATERNEKTVQFQTPKQTSQITQMLNRENQPYETKNIYQIIDNSFTEKPHNLNELDEKLCKTPQGESMPVRLSPLQRSAEKTDYTYAKSVSYRSSITPGKTIVIPNMARNSIDRNGSASNNEYYSSPELRPTFRNSDPYQPTSSYFSKTKGFGYGTDFDSDYELDSNDRDQYVLKAPTSRNSVSHFTRTCASGLLLSALNVPNLSSLDSAVNSSENPPLPELNFPLPADLTSNDNSSPQSAYENELPIDAHPPPITNINYPSESLDDDEISSPVPPTHSTELPDQNELSNSVPPTHSAELPYQNELSNPVPPPPVVIVQPCPEPSHSIEEIKQEIQLAVERELEDTKNTLLLLKKNYEEKITDLLQRFDSYKEKLLTVESMNKPCYDACRKSSPEVVNAAIETKWAALMSNMFDSTGFDVLGFAEAARLFKDSQPDIQELKELIKTSVTKQEAVDLKLESIEMRMEEREKEILSRVTYEVKRVALDWEKNGKMALLEDSKNQVVIEVAKQVKNIELKSEGGVDREEVRKLIHAALELYDSDKTGQADYALEPAGGVVLSTRCTELFTSHRPRISIWGFSLWSEPNNPRVVIQPGIVPGQCWSFRGFDGYLVVQLSRRIIPTAFSLEHIPKRLAPDGRIDSAPKNFSVFGLQKEKDNNGTPLGQFTYDNTGEPLQTFQVMEKDPGVFPIVELRIHSNHGNMNYTCLYRFRVHGQVVH